MTFSFYWKHLQGEIHYNYGEAQIVNFRASMTLKSFFGICSKENCLTLNNIWTIRKKQVPSVNLKVYTYEASRFCYTPTAPNKHLKQSHIQEINKTWSERPYMSYFTVEVNPSFSKSLLQCNDGIHTPIANLTQRWPNVDPVGSTLAQRGPNVPCSLGTSRFSSTVK